ncbi:hypothetical protein BT93_C2239 [Corymbia citriodora subsp. variegata]|nr:hypothetical protein BT93_C2239 [Corymbia citriodora subsp. variegata]
MELLGGNSLPLCGESSSSLRRDYEVFLSFRGPDTRLTITDSLYAAMSQAGICVFKDDEKLHVGEEIGGELLRAISNSKIYIPIFSKNYASSKWCLRELAYMVECSKRDEKVILPIFYGVDASYLKLRTGSYGKALRKYERQFGKDTMKQWEEALREVAGIKGWNLKDHGQHKLITLVLEEVLGKLTPKQRNWCDGLVGIRDRMEAVMELLSLGTSDVRFVVIHGMGGIGKTTLAKSIFKCISSRFQSRSFLSNIRDKDILSLQQELSCEILGIRYRGTIDADEGRDMIKERLNNKKVILVLDDMDKEDQLMKLAGESSWFGPGSRIIITTRNTYFLALETDDQDDNIIPLNHRDFYFYEMEEMQSDHALQLFSKHSFKRDSPPYDYIDISRKIVKTTGGLPLALEVIGSLLHSKSMRTWKETLKELERVPNQDVQRKLKISYTKLKYEHQQIFLDIACHCIGYERIPAYYMWKACGFLPNTGLNVLIHLSLIKVFKDDRLWMHDQLRDLGREIVRQECVPHHGKRSRLWCPTIALNVVQNNLVNDELKVIYLASCNYLKRTPNFSNCMNLKKLVLKDCARLEEIDGSINQLGRLKCLEIKGNYLLERNIFPTVPLLLDSIGGLKFLSVLKVERHNGVRKLPHSIGELLRLEKLSLRLCCNLKELPNSIGELRLLHHLDLLQTGVDALPDSIGRLESLRELILSFTEIAKLPHSIGNLRQLKFMDLSYTKIRELWKSIQTLENLEVLWVNGCENLEGEIPSEIAGLSQLKILNLSQTKVSRLPMTMKRLFNLRELDLGHCMWLQLLPDLPTSLTNLKIKSSSLQAVPDLSNLTNLDDLTISDCGYFGGNIIVRGQILHSNLEWLGRLHQLHVLNVVFSDSNMHPTNLSALCQLQQLDMTCADPQSLTGLPSSLVVLTLRDVKTPITWSLFSNLNNLSKLNLRECPLREIEFDDVLGQLENLRRLVVASCKSLERLSNLTSLKEQQHLSVYECPQLIEIKSEPSLTGDCSSTERPIPGTLKLETLCSFDAQGCKSLQKIPNARDTFVFRCPMLDGFARRSRPLGPPRLRDSPEKEDLSH